MTATKRGLVPDSRGSSTASRSCCATSGTTLANADPRGHLICVTVVVFLLFFRATLAICDVNFAGHAGDFVRFTEVFVDASHLEGVLVCVALVS